MHSRSDYCEGFPELLSARPQAWTGSAHPFVWCYILPWMFFMLQIKKKKKAKKPQPFIHRPGTTPLPAALPKPLVRITASGQRGGRASQPAARVCREFLQILRCGPLPPRPISAQTSVRAPAGGTVGLAPCLGLEFQHRLKRQGPCPRGTDIGEGGKHQSNEVTV